MMTTATVEQMKNEIRVIKNVCPLWMLRRDGLYLINNRTKLIASLTLYKERIKQLIKIQTVIRTFLAKSMYQFKKHRKNCTNDCDFCTMDPLNEIPVELLICYNEENTKPYYAFNMISLLNYFYKSRSTCMTNPYNRDKMDLKIIYKWLCLTRIFYPNTFSEIKKESFFKYFMNKRNGTYTRQHPHPRPPPPISTIIATELESPNTIQYNTPLIYEEEHISLHQHLTEMNQMQLNSRIHELFIDFDLCGNYTSADWFLHLQLRTLKMFYLRLHDLWRNLPTPIQQSICTLGDPFYLVYIRNFEVQRINSFYDLKQACVRIMEYITYGTHNKEDQKLGVFQILIALASVSFNAHSSLTHLLNL